MKKESELQMLMLGAGRMLGDYECINGLPSQTSLICNTTDAKVHIVKKEDFLKLKDHGETWRLIST